MFSIFYHCQLDIIPPMSNRPSPIWMTSHERHGVPNNRQLDCLFNRLFKLTTKTTWNHRISGSLWWESTSYRWIPFTNGQLSGARFITTTSSWCLELEARFTIICVVFSVTMSRTWFLRRVTGYHRHALRAFDGRCGLQLCELFYYYFCPQLVVQRGLAWLKPCQHEHVQDGPRQ